jgi:Domain of unknown function (DUF4296)
MRTGLLIALVVIFTAGCKSKNAIPNSVLPQKKMQAILWDMMRADQFLADYVLNKDSSLNKTTESLKYYQQIFAIHKTSKEEFQHSFSFYKSRPVLLKAMMDSISTPPSDKVPTLAKPDSVTTSPTLKKDTGIKAPQKKLPDTSATLKKKIKPVAI